MKRKLWDADNYDAVDGGRRFVFSVTHRRRRKHPPMFMVLWDLGHEDPRFVHNAWAWWAAQLNARAARRVKQGQPAQAWVAA